MHDIGNPQHGCMKCSEGCQHCYMYFRRHILRTFRTDILKDTFCAKTYRCTQRDIML